MYPEHVVSLFANILPPSVLLEPHSWKSATTVTTLENNNYFQMFQNMAPQGQTTMLSRRESNFFAGRWNLCPDTIIEENLEIQLPGQNVDMNFQMTTDGGGGDVPTTLAIW